MSLAKLKAAFKAKDVKTYQKGLTGSEAVLAINNSFTTMEGFSDASLALIRDKLTYENQEVIFELQQLKIQIGMAFRYKNIKKAKWLKAHAEELEANKTICWLKGNKFPTGHLSLVLEALEGATITYSLEDLRVIPKKAYDFKWVNQPLEPRYFQKDMLALAMWHHRGVFESAVGSGKTYTSELLVSQFGVPTVMIAPSKDLSIQIYDCYRKSFGDSMVELIDSPKKTKSTKPIRICTIHTLTGLLKKNALEEFLADIGAIIIDEVHHAGAKSYTDLLPYFEHIYYRFGFSGTFMRNDSKTLDLWGFISTVLYRYSATQATKEGFLTPLKVVVHEIEGMAGNTYQREYTRNYCQNVELLSKIRSILDNYTDENDQILILVGRKDSSGKVIHEFLNELGISNEYVSGDSKRDHVRTALKNFNEKKTKVLIGSSIIGEGIDIRSTSHLIMCQGGKSEIAITQAIGRAVRLFPGKKIAYIHDFHFNYTRYLSKHLNNRLDIYKKNFDGDIDQ